MAHLMFGDVETTGTEEEDRLCQLAFKCGTMEHNQNYRPPVPIGLVAMSIHHITNEDVVNKGTFEESSVRELLLKHADKTVFVAHNARFDLGMLAKEGVEFGQHICTLRVARHLDTKAKLEKHTLQYLRYLFRLKFAEPINPHDAWSDVLVLEGVFWYLVNHLCKINDYREADALAHMMEISLRPSLIRRFRS